MLLVIFGAGASYDSCSSFPSSSFTQREPWFRPPLARELFLNHPVFRDRSSRYGGRFQPLLPFLEQQEDVEQILERYQAEAERNPERRSQLVAIQYYLRDIIFECEQQWTVHTHGVSNYRTLLDEVRLCQQVCFVTFNYDTLMERALKAIDVPLETTADYVAHSKFKLIKLHGSINWAYWIPKITSNLRPDEYHREYELIRAAPQPRAGSVIGLQSPGEAFFSMPALAVPTASKHSFVCPTEHVEELRTLIPRVTKIAIVGWRAAEQNFLESGLQAPVRIVAACGNKDAADATLGRLSAAGIEGDLQAAPGGFTDFVVNRRIVPFLPD
jgi:hypothetical protein